MSAAREEILTRIRRANGACVAAPGPAGPIPARARGDAAALRRRFLDGLERAGASHAVVAGRRDVAGEIGRFLAAAEHRGGIVASHDPALDGCGLAAVADLRRGVPGPDDPVSVTGAVAAIAETGTLMVRSGPDIANSLHFLPDTHIAVIGADRIVGAYEDAFDLLRAGQAAMPRSVTLITGPSRSSDIERILQIGVHGPRALHVVVCDGA